jgi:hypothetical protein
LDDGFVGIVAIEEYASSRPGNPRRIVVNTRYCLMRLLMAVIE